MLFKIVAALGAVGFAIVAARIVGEPDPLAGARGYARMGWTAVLLLAIPCAFAVLPGYVPVVRSQALTFLFFGALLYGLELIRVGRRWPVPALVALLLVWTNVHGGFVVGLATIAVYALCESAPRRLFLVTLAGAVLVTLLSPYGWRFWGYLVPALLHPRADITEWGPMPVWGLDPYVGFRVLFVGALWIVAAGWRRLSWRGAILLLLTAGMAWHSRRHAPFFGLAALVFLPPCLAAIFDRSKIRVPLSGVFAVYGVVAVLVSGLWLPRAGLEPAVPNGYYPVRALDVLEAAGVTGNLAVPFRWGSYVSWRLFPEIKVSIDGRYEEVYPEESFEMNRDFFYHNGPHWDRLLQRCQVDYVLLEKRATRLTPAELESRGYVVVWADPATALLARNELAGPLREAATALPPDTREPLDPQLPDRWWP